MTSSTGAARVARALIVLGWLDCAIGSLLVLTDQVQFIVITGLILAALSAMTFLAGVLAPSRRARLVGVVHMGFCIFLFILLSTRGPRADHALFPVLVASAAYTVFSLLLGAWAWSDSPRRANPWVCVRCGYLLRGLATSRCPECGTPFDREQFSPSPFDQSDLADD